MRSPRGSQEWPLHEWKGAPPAACRMQDAPVASHGGGGRQDCRLNGPDPYANPHSEPSQYERGTEMEKSANFVLEIFLSNGIDSPVAK